MDGYLRNVGVPVNLQAPNLKGVLSGLQPIQLGGQPIQIRALGGWDVPTSQPYIANALASLGKSISSGIEAAAEQKRKRQEKKEEREFKEEEAKKDRQLKLDIENAKERIKKNSATSKGAAEADSFFSESVGQPSSEQQEGEPALPGVAEGESGGLQLIDGVAPKKEGGPSSLRGIPSQAAAQAERGASGIPDWRTEENVTGPIERGLIAGLLTGKIPVTPEGKPDSTAQQAGLLSGAAVPAQVVSKGPLLSQAKAPEAKEAPFGRGVMGEPNLRPVYGPKGDEFPATFKNAKQYWKVKDYMDKSPDYSKTLSGDPKLDPKTGMVFDAKYLNKSEIESKKKEHEGKLKIAEEKQDFYKRQKIKNATIQEGKAILQHPTFKNFESQNGYRPMTANFISSYEAVLADPKQAGSADLDMVDYFVRAASGGKPTEAQIESIKKGKSWGEILGLTVKDRPLTGALLSQGQRDQMLRIMTDNYNKAATFANSTLNTARKRMIKEGQTDEDYLPQPYVNNLMMKSEAKKEIATKASKYKELEQKRQEAIRTNNKRAEDAIAKQMSHLHADINELKSRLEKEEFTDSPILGLEDFKTKNQGFVGGGAALVFGPEGQDEGALSGLRIEERDN